ncbi:MAG TPA: PAS domain-containing protein [Thauera sp.]|uniref:hybrid sensor histidine kinase/response regulator n=1 Tax=Thauera sp. TaxID=1905334 RepID=UPI002C5B2350|nr:PAS domain-containing protein [Thauera sp.]HRP23373.1 PAS domain-containing protein [Thauera sp.]HRP66705.1 PAS domain-containing protein [Thauera sp.]
MKHKDRRRSSLRARHGVRAGGAAQGTPAFARGDATAGRLLQAERSLRASELRLRQVLDQSKAVVFWKDLDGRYLFVNREFCRLVARPAEQVIGRCDADVMPLEVAARLRANDGQVVQSRQTITFEEQVVFGGRPRTYLVDKFPLLDAAGAPYAVCGIATDITARKRVEEALQGASLAVSGAGGGSIFQALARYLATIIRSDWIFIAVRDSERAHWMHVLALWCDGELAENFDYDVRGTPCETVIGQQFRVYPQGLGEHFPLDADFAQYGMESYAGYPLADTRGEPLGLIAAVSRRPISDPGFVESVMKIFAVRAAAELERDRMDRALRASEASYRAIFEASEDCIFIHDIDTGALVDVNQRACTVYGYDHDTLLAMRVGDLGPGVEPYTEADARRLMQRARDGEVVRAEWRRRNADGSLHWDEVCLKRICLAGVDRILAVTRDITAAKESAEAIARSEAQLRQAQKMEAIGHLAGGIAHDFNNILTSINGYLALAEDRQAELGDARLGRYLEQARLSTRRARDLIRQLLTFSRGQRGMPRPLALQPLVEELAFFLAPMLPPTVAFEVQPPGLEASVMADPVQLEQVLMNLCINARDAVEGRGRIRIGVEAAPPGEAVCASCRASMVTDGQVALVVADDGPGIPPDTLERMFEPFFSTKPVGKGSGMGLATVHGIVHEHGGHILIDTAAAAGTRFRVLLPILSQPAAQAGSRGPEPDRPVPVRLAGRILLADDEDMVRGFLRELLEGWGLAVEAATDGREGRALFAADPAAFDVVLTDLTMPHMTGLELAQEIRRLSPATPVLLFSGYADGVGAEALHGAGVLAVLPKPVEPASLYAALTQALSPRPPA